MPAETHQIKMWSDKFGKEYTDRNVTTLEELDELYLRYYGRTRTDLNREFLDVFDRDIKILEAGANVGAQLVCLQKMGFRRLYGIELQPYAIELSKTRTSNINIIPGTIFDIPFKDGYFDLVFTSNVLIHINPDDIENALREIYRCTRRHIWGFEYYSDEYEEVVYRGNENLLWKTDYAKLYLNQFSDLALVKEEKMKYLDDENVDKMYLLEKR